MSNLLNNQFHNLRLEIDMSEYWDFFINKDSNVKEYDITDGLTTRCLASFIDIKKLTCVLGDKIMSVNEWDEAIAVPHSLTNIGYTGVDNGLIPFKRDEVDTKTFVDIYQNSKYPIQQDYRLTLKQVDGATKKYDYPIKVEDNRIKLNGGFYQGFFKTECDKYQVLPDKLEDGDTWGLEFVLEKVNFEKESNKTLNNKYPNNKGIFFYIGTRAENKWYHLYNDLKFLEDKTSYFDDYLEFCGDGCLEKSSFTDLSLSMPIEWESETMDDYLSFKYYNEEEYDVEEHGLEEFFYEKHKANTIDETLKNIEINCWCKNSGPHINKKKKYHSCCNHPIEEVNNLSCGYISKHDEFDLVDGLEFVTHDEEYLENDLDIKDFEFNTDDGFNLKIGNQFYIDTDNQFLLFDRTKDGILANEYIEGIRARIEGVRNSFKENLFLLLNRTCTGYTANDLSSLEEESKIEYNVNADVYENALAFRITDEGEIGYRYVIRDCESEVGYRILEGYSKKGIIKENVKSVVHVRVKGFKNTMVLEFYVNGKLLFLTKEMPKINLRNLNDIYQKQEGVPFNISLGGGSQGLIETILPNYMDDVSDVCLIEKNFAGSFIGYLYTFRFYTCKLNYFEILNNSKYELKTN